MLTGEMSWQEALQNIIKNIIPQTKLGNPESPLFAHLVRHGCKDLSPDEYCDISQVNEPFLAKELVANHMCYNVGSQMRKTP